jgi:hypothetical protein
MVAEPKELHGVMGTPGLRSYNFSIEFDSKDEVDTFS